MKKTISLIATLIFTFTWATFAQADHHEASQESATINEHGDGVESPDNQENHKPTSSHWRNVQIEKDSGRKFIYYNHPKHHQRMKRYID